MMDTLTLENLYYIGELLGVLVIISSLFYVGRQVRQQTEALQVNTAHQVAEQLQTFYTMTITESELFMKAMMSMSDLSGPEKARIYALMHQMFRIYENIFYQSSRRSLDERQFHGIRQSMLDLANQPGAKTYWKERKHWYAIDFQNHMENEILTIGAHDGFHFAGT